MSTTTQILFNSPALHSLKRDQLVKLCKIHSIKASGKNVELVERLKQHAQKLPKDSPLSIASRSEDNTDDKMDTDDADATDAYETASVASTIPRPSEQWEIMESIAEVEESSSQGSMASRTHEFGTGSSKSTTVTSSLRSFATSLGLKRNGTSKSTTSSSTSFASDVPPVPVVARNKSVDELTQYSIPYSSLPVPSPSQAPKTDNFTFTPTATIIRKFDFNNTEESTPLPGHVLRPGMPAPANARLSMGLNPATPSRPSIRGVTTTMRLVSNPSAPSQPETTEFSTPKLKPFQTSFDLVLGSPSDKVASWPPPAPDDSPTRLYPTLPQPFAVPSPSRENVAPGAPTATSGGLAPPAAGPFVFGSPDPKHRVSNAQFQAAAASVLQEMNKRLEEEGVEGIGNGIIDGLHPGASKNASKCDRPVKPLRKSAVGAGVKEKFSKVHEEQFSKMESIGSYWNRKMAATGSTSSKQRVSHEEPVKVGAKRKSNVLGDSEGQPRRPTAPPARRSVAETRVISNGRRTGAMPGGFGDDEEEGNDEDARDSKRPKVDFASSSAQRTEEASQEPEKTDKEREAVRRKLEMARARRRSSAANGRVSMNGRPRPSMGAKGKQAPAKASRFGFIGAAAKSIVKGVWGGRPKAPAAPAAKAPLARKPVTNLGVNKEVAKSAITKSRIPSSSSTLRSTSGSMRPPSVAGTVTSGMSSNRSRSPIPSFDGNMRSTATGTTSTRTSSIAKASTSSAGSRASNGPASKISSLGTRTSSGTGLKRNISASSSRLLAPTASSLAKTHASISRKSVVAPIAETSQSRPLGSITNSPNTSVQPIFSKPLVIPTASGIPSPVRPTTAATDPKAGPELNRTRSTTGRRPRISRSKVIAKLASQRAAGGAPSSSRTSAGPLAPSKKLRSSLDVRSQRKSGAGARGQGDAAVLLSAKKRARQSEYARRKSRVTPKLSLNLAGPSSSMDVDA